MTISSQNRQAGPYLGNDVATAFTFAFKVFAASDLQVVRTDAAGVACVCWEKDWRVADQSDGVAEKTAEGERAGDETYDGVHGEGALGAADPFGAQDVRKPVLPRAAGVLPRARFRQPQLF